MAPICFVTSAVVVLACVRRNVNLQITWRKDVNAVWRRFPGEADLSEYLVRTKPQGGGRLRVIIFGRATAVASAFRCVSQVLLDNQSPIALPNLGRLPSHDSIETPRLGLRPDDQTPGRFQ